MTPYYTTPPPPPYHPPMRPKNGIGTFALVVAVLGLAVCWSVLGGLALGAVAIVMGLIGRGRANRGQATNRTVATSGIALGALAIVVSLAIIPAWVRVYREVQMPAYFDCVATTSDQDGVRTCVDEFQKRIDVLFTGGAAAG